MKQVDNYVAMHVVEKGILELMQCPAKGKKCRKCKKEGHFEVCCKTDTKKTRSWRRPATVRSVESDSNHDNENEDVYVFTVNNGLENSDFIIEV